MGDVLFSDQATMKKLVPIILFSIQFSSCGSNLSLSTKPTFKVRTYTSLEPATAAEGDSSPASLDFTLKAITMTPDDGTDDVKLCCDDSVVLTVSDRPQQVYLNEDFTDYKDKTFTTVTLELSSKLTVNAKDGSTAKVAGGSIYYAEKFKVSKTDHRILTVKIKIGKTLTFDETKTPSIRQAYDPEFIFKYE